MIKRLAEAGLVDADFCGVLSMVTDPRTQERQNGLMARLPDKPDLVKALNRDEASTAFGLPLPAGGLFYPNAGWVNPPSFVNALLDGIAIHLSTEIVTISDDTSGKILTSRDGVQHGPFDAVIIAGSTETGQLSQTAWRPDQYISAKPCQRCTWPRDHPLCVEP